MDKPKEILIVDDEKAIADTIVYALQRENFATSYCDNGSSAIDKLKQSDISLIVLDIGLPDMTGFELCKKIRSFSNTPIIFLTARHDEIDKILGLEIGADDYVTKPFSPRELVARIKTVLKRQTPAISHNEATSEFSHQAANFSIHYQQQRISFTTAEYKIVAQLLEHQNIVFSRTQLLDIAGASEDSTDRTIDAHIKSIRAKIKNAQAPDFIQTHRGLGYSWSPNLSQRP